MDPINWPKPKWLDANVKFIHHTNYKDYLATKLRARYSEIETDFKTLYPDYLHGDKKDIECIRATAVQLVCLLSYARELLEKGLSSSSDKINKYNYLGKQDLLLATNILDLAEECMIWIYPNDVAAAQKESLIARIEETKNFNDNKKKIYIQKLKDLPDKTEEKYIYQPVFDEIIWLCNKNNLDEMINIGLQIERLVHFVKWGKLSLVVFFLMVPLIINLDVFTTWSLHGNSTIYDTMGTTGKQALGNWTIGGWHLYDWSMANKVIGSHYIPIWHIGNFLLHWMQAIIVWLASLGIVIMGGIGGYLSGLIQTRSSRTSLALYEESVLLSHLRLIFGGFAGLISFVLLSWNLLSGVSIDSLGPLVLAAFLSGFSERYFIDLLKIKPENLQNKEENEPIDEQKTESQTKEKSSKENK